MLLSKAGSRAGMCRVAHRSLAPFCPSKSLLNCVLDVQVQAGTGALLLLVCYPYTLQMACMQLCLDISRVQVEDKHAAIGCAPIEDWMLACPCNCA